MCNDQSVLLIVWIWDDLIFLPYLFTIPPSSNYLLREIKQSKKLSRRSAWDLIKETVSLSGYCGFSLFMFAGKSL